MPSPKPAVIVRREFEATPQVVTQQLRACIVGPSCELVRFNNSAEKANGFVKTISSLASDTVSSGLASMNISAADSLEVFPALSGQSMLDAASVKVFMEDALLSYADFADSDNDFRPAGVTTGTSNSLVLAATTWKGAGKSSGGTDIARNNAIVQDVAIGDTVQLYTVSGSTANLIKTTKVAGFVSDSIAGSFGTPTASLIANAAAPSLSNSYSGTTGLNCSVQVSQAFNNNAKMLADPRRFGKVVTTYTVAVVSFDGTNVGLSVVSDTGGDNKIGIVALSGGVLILDSGIEIEVDGLAGSTVTIGGSFTFVYGPTHTAYSYGTAGALKLTLSGNVSASLPKDTVYYLTCISGGSVKSSSGVTFRLSTNNGADVVSVFTVSGLSGTQTGLSQAFGSYGLSLAFGQMSADTYAAGFVKGDQLVVPVTAAKQGAVRTMVVADPYIATTAIARVRLSKQKTVEIPPFRSDAVTPNWSLVSPADSELRRVNLRSKLVIRDSAVGAASVDVPVTAGKLYLQFRGFRDLPRSVGSVNTLSDITSQLGVIDSENPLAYGVFKAWSNSNGATVHFIPTVSDTLNGYRGFADALDMAKGVRNCYSLVPLSASPEVWNAFVAHAKDESAPEAGRYRIVWIAPEVNKHFQVQNSPVGDTGTILTASTSAVVGQPGKYYLVATSGLDSRFTETTRVGDFVRANFGNDSFGNVTFSEYRVLSVVDNTTLVVAASSDPNLVSSQIEIFRDLSPAELAVEYVKISGGFSSERVFAVVPNRGVNGMRVGGKAVRNYYLAAAFAGLRAGSRPHQPLSNVELLGFDGNNPTVPAFNESDLDTLRDGGVWVVVNDESGKIYAERQLSTSTLDNFRKEQSVTSNVDSMSFAIADSLKNLVGRVNITNNNLETVRVNLIGVLNQFQNAAGSLTIGAQLNSYNIEEIFVPTTANDTVRAKISIVVPLPMNTIDITLVI
jgi:hypothetical protein